jgi:hypothetical protein
VNRRAFIFGIAVLPIATTLALRALPLGALPLGAEADVYENFLSNVRRKVIAIVREHGRAVHRLEFGPPHSLNGRTVREVRLQLQSGGSLLDRTGWGWEESC